MSEREKYANRVHARFYRDAVLNEYKSKIEGRPIYDEVELVEFLIPGDRLTRPVAPVNERPTQNGPTYAEIYKDEYAAFKRGEQRAASGTPLEHWANPLVTRARVAELKALNVFSVEDVASVSDGNLPQLGMGGRDLREQARAYLAHAKDSAAVSAAVAERDALLARIDAMQKQIAELAASKSDKPIDECSDDELKSYIKKHTGAAPVGRVSRETLVERATQIAAA